ESPHQSNQQPMSVHRGMPVVAAVESGSQFSRRFHIRIAAQRMTDVIWVFFVDAREREIGESLRSIDVKTGGCDSALSTRNVRSKKEKNSPNCGPHRSATLNQA